MDSVRGQGGIQMLLTAEQDGQQIVNNARNSKMACLRQAKEGADRELQLYRTNMEAEHQKKIADDPINVKRLEEETDTKIKNLKESASKVQSDIVGMLIKYVTRVKI
ncbi:V-type proton ATPase subunit G1-like [Pyrus ussuriensis x Pyrus communis]|uniref:V-type proton ATPase subunit G n=1 Tax=Pyrus ussuriensis x Pyrus communis TaxID=2448454 RepID=A0A5N5HP26_9ROSA|nr:V-type proton ATPase subunit G1-like [Pyrus ussuriensis x Pyrus communis]